MTRLIVHSEEQRAKALQHYPGATVNTHAAIDRQWVKVYRNGHVYALDLRSGDETLLGEDPRGNA